MQFHARVRNIVIFLSFLFTAILLYTSEMPVVVDNSVAVTTMSIQQNTFDPIHDLVNVTGARR